MGSRDASGDGIDDDGCDDDGCDDGTARAPRHTFIQRFNTILTSFYDARP